MGIISTGLDKTAFAATVQPQLEALGADTDKGDPVGFGTYVTGVVLQVARQARITVFGVYPGRKFHGGWLPGALDHFRLYRANFDVVLLAFPPEEFADPVSAAMAAGEWEAILDAMEQNPLRGASGPVYGAPLDEALYSQQVAGRSPYQAERIKRFRTILWRWEEARRLTQALVDAGVAVVAPAGDVGEAAPRPQTLFGIGNFPHVVTVGGYNPDPTTGLPGAVSAETASGPSIDLRVKPDLLAPTGILAAPPKNSALADHARQWGAIVSVPPPDWASVVDPPPMAVLDTTLTAATVVAAALARLRSEGITDVARQRAALTAKAVPLPGVPVWRQGAGALPSAPSALFVNAPTPLLGSHADLGLEPPAAPWSVTVPVLQGDAVAPSVRMTDFVGLDYLANTITRDITSAQAPDVTATTTLAGDVEVSAEVGNDDLDAGVYCGYVTTRLLPTRPGDSPDDAPLCLVNGFKPVARGSYIHDQSADDLTFGIAPTLPPGTEILNHPLHMLPVNPLGATFFTQLTDTLGCPRYQAPVNGNSVPPIPDVCAGHARFTLNIPPGYYAVRGWADYGTPVAWSVTDEACQPPASCTVRKKADIGQPITYSSFRTLLIPKERACTESYGRWDDWSGHLKSEEGYSDTWKVCTQEEIEQYFRDLGVPPVQVDNETPYDRPTGGFRIESSIFQTLGLKPPTEPFRVNAGFLRKVVDTTVSWRAIDIVHPCNELRFLTLHMPPITEVGAIAGLVDQATPWDFGCPQSLESVVATLAGGGSMGTDVIGYGIAWYPFNLPTPNYKAHVSLNLAYEVENAAILVEVQMGNEWGVGWITPDGVFTLPSVQPDDPIDLGSLAVHGVAQGTANFEFNLLPRGVTNGKIWLGFVPEYHAASGGTQNVSRAEIKDDPADPTGRKTFSFEVDTSIPWGWPATNFYNRTAPTRRCADDGRPANDCGHTHRLDPRFSPRTLDQWGRYASGQIANPPECRTIGNGEERAQVCEDWTVVVHSPRPPPTDAAEIGASLMEVWDVGTSTSLMDALAGAGAVVLDAQRGVNQGTHGLAFGGTAEQAESSFALAGGSLKTNGAFFEQIAIPLEVVRAARGADGGEIEVCFNDGETRRPPAPPGPPVPSDPMIDSICKVRPDGSGGWVGRESVPDLARVSGAVLCTDGTDPGEDRGGYKIGCGAEVEPYVSYLPRAVVLDG